MLLPSSEILSLCWEHPFSGRIKETSSNCALLLSQPSGQALTRGALSPLGMLEDVGFSGRMKETGCNCALLLSQPSGQALTHGDLSPLGMIDDVDFTGRMKPYPRNAPNSCNSCLLLPFEERWVLRWAHYFGGRT